VCEPRASGFCGVIEKFVWLFCVQPVTSVTSMTTLTLPAFTGNVKLAEICGRRLVTRAPGAGCSLRSRTGLLAGAVVANHQVRSKPRPWTSVPVTRTVWRPCCSGLRGVIEKPDCVRFVQFDTSTSSIVTRTVPAWTRCENCAATTGWRFCTLAPGGGCCPLR
jgi:hypothetical protein